LVIGSVGLGLGLYLLQERLHQDEPAEGVRIELVGLRIEESVTEGTDGMCRNFTTKFTLATQESSFSVPGNVVLKLRDGAKIDPHEAGEWIVKDCQMLPLSLGAFRVNHWATDGIRPEGVDNGRYIAACGFEVRKHCYDESVGGAYQKKAVPRERPKWELEFVSYSFDRGDVGTLVQ
jgi:hypothetical protein